jgi:hypothetical protein
MLWRHEPALPLGRFLRPPLFKNSAPSLSSIAFVERFKPAQFGRLTRQPCWAGVVTTSPSSSGLTVI